MELRIGFETPNYNEKYQKRYREEIIKILDFVEMRCDDIDHVVIEVWDKNGKHPRIDTDAIRKLEMVTREDAA